MLKWKDPISLLRSSSLTITVMLEDFTDRNKFPKICMFIGTSRQYLQRRCLYKPKPWATSDSDWSFVDLMQC